jgi:hypothetical protein
MKMGEVMKFVLLALIALAALWPRGADAMSAFAAGIPPNVAAQGVAFGDGYNFATRAAAEKKALDECQAQGDAPATTRSLCTILAYFDNECLAVSIDPAAGTPGYGWAVAATSDLAKGLALGYCRQTAGPSRQDACVVSFTDCDTVPPLR